MDLIRAYQDEGTQSPKEEEENRETVEPVLKKMHVDLAPSLPVSKQVGKCIVVSVQPEMVSLVNNTKKTLKYNPTVDEMYKPVVVGVCAIFHP